jgi:uncharacterized protein (DUF697 family)
MILPLALLILALAAGALAAAFAAGYMLALSLVAADALDGEGR